MIALISSPLRVPYLESIPACPNIVLCAHRNINKNQGTQGLGTSVSGLRVIVFQVSLQQQLIRKWVGVVELSKASEVVMMRIMASIAKCPKSVASCIASHPSPHTPIGHLPAKHLPAHKLHWLCSIASSIRLAGWGDSGSLVHHGITGLSCTSSHASLHAQHPSEYTACIALESVAQKSRPSTWPSTSHLSLLLSREEAGTD